MSPERGETRAETGADAPPGWQLALSASPAQAEQLAQQEQAEAESLGLPLYGRADHAHAQARPTGLSERLGLACRGAYLLLVFLPFLTVGVALLLLAAALGSGSSGSPPGGHPATSSSSSSPAPPTVAAGDRPSHTSCPSTSAVTATGAARGHPSSRGGGSDSGSGSGGHGGGSPHAVPIKAAGAQRRRREWRRGAASACRRAAWRLLLGGCRRSGAAFIKWGQWSATRVDLFPDDFCEALSSLHDRAPTHSFAFTRKQVESSFGCALECMFEAFDPRPIASGSIAQVHRALMRRSDGTPLDVAVKVVHPRVALRIRQDFALLLPAASALGRVPSLRSLSLPETVSQFSASMTAQADLRVEAAHLRRFHANFARVAGQVTTPRPLPGLVRREVLVESWEAGRSVAGFIRRPTPLNTAIVCLGVDTYLKMLLQDNFVHTDLHPGNIMVRMVDREGAPMPLPPPEALSTPPQAAQPSSHPRQPHQPPRPAHGTAAGGASGTVPAATAAAAAPGPDAGHRVQLVLLDFGLAEELTPTVRYHFISFLHHLMRGDGAAAAAHLLRWTSRRQACPDPRAFVADMRALAAARCDVRSLPGIDLDAVMKDVLRLARRHRVTIDSCYASLVIAVCVIVGFATSLDPGVNLVDAAVPAMLAHALTGRVVGRLYS
ncbi:hypothetical protein GPECTOR_1g2 [Gonium pectorale]|uniref:ABC1 atypical kinase-like domain-containing protein n=1 Tax=Gonium pectorale TaxID=33097 RepID=A0A150H260_GONPE|nr:hypothetical protein GPECTOR_1g2 [Gonium pectorale]|eukprot:KXZ56229.1 hypothetical protein GPECTOR_1g2 [Gonium pectorale]